MRRAEVGVLVVGAGAAGLAAAATLGRYGIDVLLVERREEHPTLPRATVVSTRSMELVRAWGLESEVLAGGIDAEIALRESPTLAESAAGRTVAVGYPSRAQAAVVSPSAPAAVPQDRLEAVLRRHVGTLPTVRVELGTELTALTTAADGVRARVRDATGRSRTVRARYLVGADGARSTVRRLLGIPTRVRGGALAGVQVLLHAPLSDLVGDVRYALHLVTTPAAPGLFLPAGRDDRWVYALTWADGDEPPDLERPSLVERIRRGAGVAGLDPRIEQIGRFRSPGELADRFRVGPAFLAGDAAHRVTPRGGTGMNTALHGGHDLGWKLAWVLQDWAGPELLDSYETERRAVAEHNLARSTDPGGSRRPVLDELTVDLGGRLPHAWLPGSGGRTSTLDLLGPGWTLFTASARTAGEAAARATRAPVAVRTLDRVTALRLGVLGDGGLLVRPDGVPAAVGDGAVARLERPVDRRAGHVHLRRSLGDLRFGGVLVDPSGALAYEAESRRR